MKKEESCKKDDEEREKDWIKQRTKAAENNIKSWEKSFKSGGFNAKQSKTLAKEFQNLFWHIG